MNVLRAGDEGHKGNRDENFVQIRVLIGTLRLRHQRPRSNQVAFSSTPWAQPKAFADPGPEFFKRV